jgi:hypothetical protein
MMLDSFCKIQDETLALNFKQLKYEYKNGIFAAKILPSTETVTITDKSLSKKIIDIIGDCNQKLFNCHTTALYLAGVISGTEDKTDKENYLYEFRGASETARKIIGETRREIVNVEEINEYAQINNKPFGICVLDEDFETEQEFLNKTTSDKSGYFFPHSCFSLGPTKNDIIVVSKDAVYSTEIDLLSNILKDYPEAKKLVTYRVE